MSSSVEYFNSIASKWQEEWERNKVFEANPDINRRKFFITVAFPYTNSPLHIGHGRTYIIADIYARYKRLNGYNVLFPFAFQFTGTPILSISEAIERGDREIIETFKNIYNINEEKIKEFKNPLILAEYFRQEMKKTARAVGLSIDWRREFTTIDEEFISLIQWQFKKLKEKNKIITQTSPVGYCPNDNFPVGMHDTRGDVEPEIESLDVILFESSDFYFAAATIRPETIFGAVAILLNTEAEYELVRINDKKLIISSKATEKLMHQLNLTRISKFSCKDLENYTAKNPVTNTELKVVCTKLVDPKFGTGVVMAVPSHEPIHFMALAEKSIEFELIPVISTPELPELPGVYYFDLSRTKNPAELKEYIDTLYRIEFHKGTIREDVVEKVPHYLKDFVRRNIVGKRVPDARQTVRELLKRLGTYLQIFEIYNGPIFCRCGSEIVVKVIHDQPFIDYEIPEWKSKVLKSLNKIDFMPPDSKKEVERVIFDLKKRAFTRSRGLGVPLPWDSTQIIDSLSDSTIYTVLYTIIHKIRGMKLSDSFWDYILLDIGNPEKVAIENNINIQTLIEIKNEFKYWYPVDSRHTGKDLLYNHIPYYLYNHIELLGENNLPRSIVVNGFVKVGGKKMSKSFRNIYPLDKAIREHGVDPIRVALATTSDLYYDNEFDEGNVKGIREQLLKIRDIITYSLKVQGVSDLTTADLWISTKMRMYIRIIRELYENFKLRELSNKLFYEIYNDIKDYLELTNGKPNYKIIRKIIENWIILFSPIVPHLAEELWHLTHESLVVNSKFPDENELLQDEIALYKIEYIKYIINRIKEVEDELKRKADSIVIYVNDDEMETEVLKKAIIAVEKRLTLREFIDSERGNEERLKQLFEVANKLPQYIKELIKKGVKIEESETLSEYAYYLINKLNIEEIRIYKSSDPTAPDIKGMKGQALPMYPSVVILK
ncbi:MAG: leucine--tRNA ligase [Sulfolobaceae archaeon]